MKDKPLITIGITAYKVGKYLNDAISSVVNQKNQNWYGILILDGGNDNNTQKIFDDFSHPKFKKYSFNKNTGPYGTRNKAIGLCETEWYYQLDGDDLLPIDAIDLIITKIKENKNIEYIYGNCEHFSLGLSSIRKPSVNIEDLCFGPLFNAQSPIKKQTILSLGGFSEDLIINADWDFWLKIHNNQVRGSYINKTIYKRRDRDNSVGLTMMNYRPQIVQNIIKNNLWFFKFKSRDKKAMANVYKKLAGHYSSLGNRNKAAEYAENAISYGSDGNIYKNIFYEKKMFYIRYKIRRFFRYIFILRSKLI